MRLVLQKTQTTAVPKMTIADKEETKSQPKKEVQQAKTVSDETGKLSDLKLATGNSMRDGIRQKLSDLITQGEIDERQKYLGTKIAYEIESQVHKIYNDRAREYSDKMRSLLSNLRDPKNPDLKKRLINGELTPHQVAT